MVRPRDLAIEREGTKQGGGVPETTLRFTWDPGKSLANEFSWRFNFVFATGAFAGLYLLTEDARRDYGERRFVAVGKAAGLNLTVVYTDRDIGGETVRRIISARPGNTEARNQYAQTSAQGNGLPRRPC